MVSAEVVTEADRDSLIEDFLRTSVSNIYFTADNVYKAWRHTHPLIPDLDKADVRYDYLVGEMSKGVGFNEGDEDVYCEVVPIVIERDCVRELDSGDLPAEDWDWVLKMKRFKDEERWDLMLINNDLESGDVEKAVEKIFNYHRNLPNSEDANSRGTAAYFDENVRMNDFRVLKRYCPLDLVRELEINEVYFLSRMKSRFQERINNGWVKDSHGDTKLTNIFSKKAIFLDAIAFMKDWSCGDLLSEIAYFLLDFDFCAQKHDHIYFEPWLEVVRNKYQELTEEDISKDPLFWFYMNYRAWVEAKVAGLEGRQNDVDILINNANGYLKKAFELAGLEWQEEQFAA